MFQKKFTVNSTSENNEFISGNFARDRNGGNKRLILNLKNLIILSFTNILQWGLQAFIQALLSTGVFLQRFSFFTVCLVQWLCEGYGRHCRENLKFRSADHWKMHYSLVLGFFLEFQGFMGSFEEMLTRKIPTTFFYACL